MGVGPIQYAVFQIAEKIDFVYKDKQFSKEVYSIAGAISAIEKPPKDWRTNKTIKFIEEFSTRLDDELSNNRIDERK